MLSQTAAGSSARRCLNLVIVVAILAAVPFPALAQAPATKPAASRPDRSPAELKREYQQRYDRLRPDDIEGHYQLAEWCRENRMYQLLFQQSKHVLQLNPGHENARLLYRLAVEQLRNQAAATRPEAGADGQPNPNEGELLTPGQIQRIKFAEFLDRDQTRAPLPATNPRTRQQPLQEFLQVRFKEDVLNEFLDQMAGSTDFGSREARTAFLTLPATLQVQTIREQTREEYQKQIEIVNSPLVFQQFEHVLPMIMNGCSTTGCHGGSDAQGWRLRTARPRTDLNLYTNFLILTRVRNGNQRLINRPKPEESLLLQYGLPTQQALYQHPQAIPVLFPRGQDDLKYRTIRTWVENLRIPEPRISVSLPGYPEPPPPQIGGKPAQQTQEAPAK